MSVLFLLFNFSRAPVGNSGASGVGGGLFSQLKGGAGSFLRNLKDTSTKVVQSVQQ